MKAQHKFNGHWYKYFDQSTYKKDAETWASKLRGRGDLARITTSLVDRRYKVYIVWVREGAGR